MPIQKGKKSAVASQSESNNPYIRDGFYGRFIFLGYHELDKNPQRNTQFVLLRQKCPSGLKFTVRASGRPRKPMPRGTLLRRYSPRILKGKYGIEFKVEKRDDHDIFQFGRDPYSNDFHIPGHRFNGRYRFNPLESLLIDPAGLLKGRFMFDVTGRRDRSIFMRGASIH
jgi:hypothetical protein